MITSRLPNLNISSRHSSTFLSVLGSYFVSTTSSHYDWAMKKLKAHQKNCKKK
nr:ClbS/DfsB family four-helix bundle protein [Streptococcus salivarius]